MTTAVVRDHTATLLTKEEHLRVPTRSALSGQPCENTIGSPVPQSL